MTEIHTRYCGGAALSRMTCLALALLAGCGGGSTPSPVGPPLSNQILSLSINPRSVPPPTQQDFDNAVNLAIGAGVKGVALTYTWSTLEPAAQTYDLSQIQPALNYFVARGFRIYLGIQVINTVKKETPADLLPVAFDSPQMLSRFHGLLTALKPILPVQVKYLSIGNEVDPYLATNPSQWSTYQVFYEDALAYAHQNLPGILVGVTATFNGAIGSNMNQVLALNTKSDVFILTYYPLQGNFQVRSPQSPATDFPAILNLAAGKRVLLQEVGFPSDPLTGGSENQESQFVSSALQSWHLAGDKMPFFNYFLEHDFDPATCAALDTYYGVPNNPAFTAYLCSLGLRRDDGSAKPAWNAFTAP